MTPKVFPYSNFYRHSPSGPYLREFYSGLYALLTIAGLVQFASESQFPHIPSYFPYHLT